VEIETAKSQRPRRDAKEEGGFSEFRRPDFRTEGVSTLVGFFESRRGKAEIGKAESRNEERSLAARRRKKTAKKDES
jgi:hypothetical protein